MEPKSYSYPVRALLPDYLRAATGLAFTVTPIPFVLSSIPALVIFGTLASLFGGFGVITWMRQRTVVTVNERGIVAEGAQPRDFVWGQIDNVDLRFFSTRRERERGWMQLRLDSRGRKLKVDSNIEGFEDLVVQVAEAVDRFDLPVTENTRSNMAAMGVTRAREWAER